MGHVTTEGVGTMCKGSATAGQGMRGMLVTYAPLATSPLLHNVSGHTTASKATRFPHQPQEG